MENKLRIFESIVRRAVQYSVADERNITNEHPFDVLNIHDALPTTVKKLFDNAHYAEATFEAYKFLDKEIQRHSNSNENGFKLMMQSLNPDNPLIKLNKMSSLSEKDEQKGYQFMFAGAILAIRNPRGHEYAFNDDLQTCLDHLSFASMLLRKVYDAGYK